MQSWGSSGAATAGTSVRDSATGDSQADDRSDSPVIVTTPLPDAGDPVKPYSSRFIRVDDVSLKDFDRGKPMDVLKNIVSSVFPKTSEPQLIMTSIAQLP